MAQRLYTTDDIHKIIDNNKWSVTVCQNELHSKINKEYDTIQVAVDEEADYFGEFFGKKKENKYQFIFYTIET